MGRNKEGVYFDCDYCKELSYSSVSKYNRKKRHYCSMGCYSKDKKENWSKEEQHRFGTGFSKKEKRKRVLCRGALNHAIRDGKISRQPCKVCGNPKSEAHHDNYNKPLHVVWLCFVHHREHHKKLYENPELK